MTPHRRLAPLALLSILAIAGCAKSTVNPPAPIVLLDILPARNREYTEWVQKALDRFTQETGIVVKRLPAPASPDEQFVLTRELLEGAATTPDVYIIDAIWPGMLVEHLLDLRPRLGAEADGLFPALVANNVVQGRLLAMPYHANVGILFFRTDLLREYGYASPPAHMAGARGHGRGHPEGRAGQGPRGLLGLRVARRAVRRTHVQCPRMAGLVRRRADRRGRRDHLRQQPAGDRGLEPGRRWIGAISPPEVAGYREGEAQDAFRAGHAAFMRAWPSNYSPNQDAGSPVRGRFDITFVPGGAKGHAMVLGENALAVSRYSRHTDEAIALVKYLSRRDVQLGRARLTSLPPTIPDLYDDPEVVAANPYYTPLKKVFLGGALSRPSSVTGHKYTQVSRAYFRAVHSVLTRQQPPAAAAAALEREIVWITGFPAAPAAAR
jgi:trehalose/maltose transport system substrate-binding protein